MTITNGYATLAQWKSFVSMRGLSGDVGPDASDDSTVEMLIESSSRYIDSESGRRFYADTNDGTYYYKADNEQEVKLPDFKSITTVSVDFSNSRTYTVLTVNTDYDLLPDNYSAEGMPINGLRLSPLSGYYFPTYEKGIKIVGKRGWTSIPDDIVHACLEIVQNIYSSRSGQASAGRISVTASGVVIRPEDVPEYAQRVIRNYRSMI